VHDSVQRLVEAGFEVLVGAGVEPEVAYLACLHELKERVDEVCAAGFVTQHGPDGEPRTSGVIDDALRGRLAQVWQQVHSEDGETPGGPSTPGADGEGQVAESRRDAGRAAHPLEQVGRRVRAMMSWIR
jgi:ketol-acid reductoisomerase